MGSNLVSIIGAPSSGKSTLATSVHHGLKIRKKNSIFVGEAATDYIAEYGVPNTPQDQMIIFYKQLNREKMFLETRPYWDYVRTMLVPMDKKDDLTIHNCLNYLTLFEN